MLFPKTSNTSSDGDHSVASCSDADDSLRMPASTVDPISKSYISPPPTPPRDHRLGSWQSVSSYDFHPDRGYRHEPRPVHLFRHWKFQPQEAGIWLTIKDLLFSMILSAGLVVVVNEILVKLVETFLLKGLYWFERDQFWTQWKLAVRWLIVVIWIAKIIFNAGTVVGRLDAKRKSNLCLRSSFRSS
jgi:hypothetical protein